MKKYRTSLFIVVFGLTCLMSCAYTMFNHFESLNQSNTEIYESLLGVDQEIFEEYMNDSMLLDDYNEECFFIES